MDVVGTTGQKECQESMIELVDTALWVSRVEMLEAMVEGMAMLVELTKEEVVETGGVTSWSASSFGTDSSCVPSYEVPADWLPTEVETEVLAWSESARLTRS